MGEPPQALSPGPLPTPCWFLPFPPPHRLTPPSGGLRDHRPQPHIPGLGPSYIPEPPTLARRDHPWPPLAPPEPASVYGTEPKRKDEEWPFHLSQAPPRTGVRDEGEGQWVSGWASLGQWPAYPSAACGQAPRSPGKGAGVATPASGPPYIPHHLLEGTSCCPAVPHVLGPLNVPVPCQASSALHGPPSIGAPLATRKAEAAGGMPHLRPSH